MARPTQTLVNSLQARGHTGASVNIDDVVLASAGWLAYAVGAAVVGWATAASFFSVVNPLVILFVAIGLAFLDGYICRAIAPHNGLMALSLGLYGYIVGAVSWGYTITSGGGIGLVGSAAVGTVVTAAIVIGLYKAHILRAETAKYRSMVFAAGLGYFTVVCLSLLLQVFGHASLFGPGVLGWVLCLAGATLAALTLTLAAADIDIAIAAGAPTAEASRLGWSFVSTLLWLYLEILRLLARARN